MYGDTVQHPGNHFHPRSSTRRKRHRTEHTYKDCKTHKSISIHEQRFPYTNKHLSTRTRISIHEQGFQYTNKEFNTRTRSAIHEQGFQNTKKECYARTRIPIQAEAKQDTKNRFNLRIWKSTKQYENHDADKDWKKTIKRTIHQKGLRQNTN